jgi:hypothetical protein
MKKSFKYILGLMIPLAFLLGCEEETYEFGDIVAPSNLQVVITVEGSDVSPQGDGSGVVNIAANASGAITYKIVQGTKEIMAPDGMATITVGKTGTHEYIFNVIAYGRGGASSSVAQAVEVYVEYTPPAEVITFLTNDSQRTWRLAAELPGHLGVGPSDGFDPIWWSAAPNEKEAVGAYDDRIIFNVDGTLQYITNGNIWGKAEAMDPDFGVAGQETNAFAEYENYPWDDFSDTWAITEPDGQLTLSMGQFGYAGMYVGGDHNYQILSRTENTMDLRIVAAEGNAWYAKLISDE